VRFVAVKSERQQAAGLVFRTRDLLVRQRPDQMDVHNRKSARQNGPRLPEARSA
jgi:hypothetical protein